MKLIYLGAEVPSNRTLLETTTANHVGVSFWRLYKRGLPKLKPYLLENYFQDDMYIYAHGGIPKHENLSQSFIDEFGALYEDFIAHNIDRITWFNELAHPQLSLEFIENQRRTAWSEVPPAKFQPVWQAQQGSEGLRKLVDTYLDIAIQGEDIESNTQLSALSRQFVLNNGTRFHALNTAKPDNLRQVPIVSASTLSWMAPMLHGETIVWDGTRLVRYNKKMKDQARTRYRHIYEKAGISYDLIMEDDEQEVCKLAVWSYEQFELRFNMSNHNDPLLSDNSDWNDGETSGETPPAISDNRGSGMRKLEARRPDEIVPLPVLGYTSKTVVEKDEDGNDIIKDVTVVSSQSATIRNCDTCFVASNCPAFKPQSMCQFNLPIEIKTKDQLKGLIEAMVEIQSQRVAFARFTEELNGGYPDPNVSQEMDRLFKMFKTVKELDDSSSFIKMTVEAKNGSAGVLSSIFGDRAQALKELPNGGFNEVETTKIIKEVIEGE